MGELRLSAAAVAQQAGTHYDTVRDFLREERWPRPGTLASIDRALDWEPGTLARIATDHADPAADHTTSPNVAVRVQDAVLLIPQDVVDRLTPEQLEEVKAAALLAARERARLVTGG